MATLGGVGEVILCTWLCAILHSAEVSLFDFRGIFYKVTLGFAAGG